MSTPKPGYSLKSRQNVFITKIIEIKLNYNFFFVFVYTKGIESPFTEKYLEKTQSVELNGSRKMDTNGLN